MKARCQLNLHSFIIIRLQISGVKASTSQNQLDKKLASFLKSPQKTVDAAVQTNEDLINGLRFSKDVHIQNACVTSNFEINKSLEMTTSLDDRISDLMKATKNSSMNSDKDDVSRESVMQPKVEQNMEENIAKENKPIEIKISTNIPIVTNKSYLDQQPENEKDPELTNTDDKSCNGIEKKHNLQTIVLSPKKDLNLITNITEIPPTIEMNRLNNVSCSNALSFLDHLSASKTIPEPSTTNDKSSTDSNKQQYPKSNGLPIKGQQELEVNRLENFKFVGNSISKNTPCTAANSIATPMKHVATDGTRERKIREKQRKQNKYLKMKKRKFHSSAGRIEKKIVIPEPIPKDDDSQDSILKNLQDMFRTSDSNDLLELIDNHPGESKINANATTSQSFVTEPTVTVNGKKDKEVAKPSKDSKKRKISIGAYKKRKKLEDSATSPSEETEEERLLRRDQGIWFVEWVHQSTRLKAMMLELSVTNKRKYKHIKAAFLECFGDDNEDEMESESPILIENHLESCRDRIAPWVVQQLMTYYKNKVIENRLLFKILARHITAQLIIKKTFPEEEDVVAFIAEYFRNKTAIKNETDIYV